MARKRSLLLRPRRLIRVVRKSIAEFVTEFLAFLAFLWSSLLTACYNYTLPVTRALLSRKPGPPIVAVQDIRANRIRFDIKSSYSSAFNVEDFEIEWASNDAPPDEWTSVGFSDITQRTVARLQGDVTYRFRVRARNERGTGSWCEPLIVKTRLDPKDGGGHGPGYTWAQTASDVTISFKLARAITKWDVKVQLKSDYLQVKVAAPKDSTDDRDEVLIDGPLYGKVLSFDSGSLWELVRESGATVLNIYLEKAVKSMAPKFDYWRSIQPGHPELEIDSHKIESEDAGRGMQMLQPDQMDPQQLQSMGFGQGFGQSMGARMR